MAAYYIDALLPDPAIGWRWNAGSPVGTAANVSFSFALSLPAYYDPGEVGGFSAMTLAMQGAAREILSMYATVARLTLTEVSDVGAGGQIRLGQSVQGGASAGFAYYPSLFDSHGGDVWIASDDPSNSASAKGSAGYLTLLHEIGHAVGLKHPGNYGVGELPPFLPAAEDSTRYTVMSYTDRTNDLYLDVTQIAPGQYNFDYRFIYPETPMLYDIAALQYLYGANTSYRAGNDVYTFDPARPFFMTIWDGGGIDTISAANFSEAVTIILAEGAFSSLTIRSDPIPAGWTGTAPTYFGQDNLSIAFGTTIERAIGGAGNDTLNGNAIANLLDGRGGADTMYGDLGNDIYLVNHAGDAVYETVVPGGVDTVWASVSYVLGPNLENLTLTGVAAISGSGNELNNVIQGNAAGNALAGGAGSDTVSYGNAPGSVTASLALTTAQNTGSMGMDTLSGFEHLTGSAFNDNLTGSAAGNVINGGAGADVMAGGAGNDTYYVDAAGDLVVEGLNAGVDAVRVGFDYALPANVENLVVTATGAANATGNGLNNVIVAGAGNNVMDGGAGVDTVSYQSAAAGVTVNLALAGPQNTGGSGVDTVLNFEAAVGTPFNDTLVGNAGNNVLTGGLGDDLLDGGAGVDTVSYATAPAGVTASLEHQGFPLQTGGAGTDTLIAFENVIGSPFGDILFGSSQANVMIGGAGGDSLFGGGGADTFVFTTTSGSDGVTDFVPGLDKLRFSQAGLRIGDGDTVVDGGVVRAGPGGFGSTAELVMLTTSEAGATADVFAAAAYIGSADQAYIPGQTALFAVTGTINTGIFLFTSSGPDALVSAPELTLIAHVIGLPTTLGDYVFSA